jgi:AcrR family transcriptional regulator
MPATARGDRVRRQILDAAVGRLTKDSGASLAEIATAAGVGRTTLHRYFQTREQLLTALGVEAVATVAAAVAEARPDDGPVPDVLARLVGTVMPVAARLRFLALGPELWDTPELAAAWYSLQETIDAVVARGQREGDLRAELPVALVADLLVGAVWGVAESVVDGRVAARDAVPGVLAVVLHGTAMPRSGA